MRTVINRTRRPIKLSLPGGKTLYLGPTVRGKVHEDALERPAIKRLIEAGEIEVLDAKDRTVTAEKPAGRVHPSTHGHPSLKNVSRRGDR